MVHLDGVASSEKALEADYRESNTAGSSDKAVEADYIENLDENSLTSPKKSGFGSKVKRHCVRFWWLHVIIFCACFLIIALSLVFAGLPRIAQQDVDKSHLELTDLQFLNPTPDSLSIAQAAILHNPSTFTPTLDPFSADSFLVHNDTGLFGSAAMVKIVMPEIHSLHPKSNATAALQVCHIDNHDAVDQYVEAVLKQEWVTSALVGKTKLHLGALPVTDIEYNTTITYKGLNGLKGFNVTDARVNITAPAGTPNLRGIAFIPNPSLITVALGDVTLSLALGSDVIGNATILDMTLRPGDNHLPMTAFIDQIKVITGEDSNGHVNLTITGTRSVYNGQRLSYYEKALGENELYLDMNVKQVIADSLKA